LLGEIQVAIMVDAGFGDDEGWHISVHVRCQRTLSASEVQPS
jgi:hypothetical protein